MISPGSVSIHLANAFSLVFKTDGVEGTIFGFCFAIEIVFELESLFVEMTSTAGVFFCGADVIFLGDDFAVLGLLVGVVFGADVSWVVCFTHSRNVISSRAKSFPHPPCILSTMINVSADVELGVEK